MSECECKRELDWMETLMVAWRTGDVMVHPDDVPLLEAGLLEAVNGRPRVYCMARLGVKGRRCVEGFVRELREQVVFLG